MLIDHISKDTVKERIERQNLGPKYLVVVYRELCGEKVIITAYFTSNVATVKGEVIWRKRQ